MVQPEELKKDDPSLVEFLLRRGAKLALPDDLAWATPIALATSRGHEEIVRVLKAYETTGDLRL